MSVQIFVAPKALLEAQLEIRGDEHHYLHKVRRVRVDDAIQVLDGCGRRGYAHITAITGSQTSLTVEHIEDVPRPTCALHVAPALVKGERMEWAIEKLVELGVSEIHPMECEHTVVRLKADKREARRKRYEAVARAACRQSANAFLPTIHPIRSLAEVLDQTQGVALRLLPHTQQSSPLQNHLPVNAPHSVLVLVGPEGGFSEAESASAMAAGCLAVHLGQRILRAESACVAMAAILGFRYGDIGRASSPL